MQVIFFGGYFFGNKEFCYGSIIDDTLFNIIHSERYWDIIDRCANTPLNKLCEGQCRHTSTNRYLNNLVEGIPHKSFI